MDRSTVPSVRGAVLLGIRDWAAAAIPAAELDALMAELPEAARAVLRDRTLLSSTWVDAAAFRELSEHLIRTCGLEGPSGFRVAAESVARSDLGSTMSILTRRGSPDFVLNRFPRVWRHYFSHGTLTVERLEPGSARVLLRGASVYGIGGVEGAAGWMRAALMHAGARGLQLVVVPGRLATPAEFKYSWH